MRLGSLLALGLCGLVGKAVRPRAAPGPPWAVGLCCSSPEVPEIDALVGRASVKTQVQVLVVTFFHRVHDFLWHPHGKGQVAAYLPHHYGRSDVPGLNLHMLPRNLLHHAQGVRSMPVPSILRAVCKRSWQFIRLCVVHLLLHTFLEILEDDCQLQDDRQQEMSNVKLCHCDYL
uniref:Secreted protein n=1 Tax=Echeneis naucrates TaxID=173247 RepID=A0A665TW13_ECHNA